MSPLKPIIPIIVLSICSASFVQAEKPGPKGDGERPPGSGEKPGGPGERKQREEPRRTTIESVSADSVSITSAKGTKSYKVTKNTVFTFKGKTVKADEVKPGMRVSVTAGTDPTVAARITADDPPKETEHKGEREGDRPGGPKGGGDHGPKPGGDRGPGPEKPKP